MQDVVPTPSPGIPNRAGWFSGLTSRVRSTGPSLTDCAVALASATLLIASFPDFNLASLAWIALVPLLVVIAQKPEPGRCFILGWLFGTVFFYGSCYWLTYSMIHTGGFPPWVAFLALLPGALVVGIFPAAFASLLAQVVRSQGAFALYLAPVIWPALEWARLEITGQLWNAMGYSQAFHPSLIQSARWGGVYAVGSLIVLVNVAIAHAVLRRTPRAIGLSLLAILFVCLFVIMLRPRALDLQEIALGDADVIAVQPNVPMDLVKAEDEMKQLKARHFEMSKAALRQLRNVGTPRLIVWPESPMNFGYGSDSTLREELATFVKANRTALLLNSQEIAPNDGIYNSALLINEEGKLLAQYDKIRLMPFGEYVPLPQWLPGAGLIRAMVGEFTPGSSYRLMPVGNVRVGVFICIESAYPSIARRFSDEGADVLINISNDGYLGPTAVMRQHLSNAVFRAVENGRPLLRVTNTGISAWISAEGEVKDATAGFKPEVRTWPIWRTQQAPTFYTKHGDWFAVGCAIFAMLALVLSFLRRSDKTFTNS